MQGFLKVDDTNLLQRTVTPMFGNNSPSELKVSDFNYLKKSTLNSEEFKNDFPIEDDFEKQISKGIEFENSFSKKNFQIEGQITGEQFWRQSTENVLKILKTKRAITKVPSASAQKYNKKIIAVTPPTTENPFATEISRIEVQQSYTSTPSRNITYNILQGGTSFSSVAKRYTQQVYHKRGSSA
jgi:hypothetical protein